MPETVDLSKATAALAEVERCISELRSKKAELMFLISEEKAKHTKMSLDNMVREMFEMNPKLRYAAMDRDGRILFYVGKPCFYQDGGWKGVAEKLPNNKSRFQITAVAPVFASSDNLKYFFWESTEVQL